MKKLIILFGLSLLICQANAQEINPIEIIDGKFYHNDTRIRNNKEILMIVEDVPEAHQLVKSGRTRIIFGYVLAGLGGAITGSALGTKIGTGSYSEENPRSNVYAGLAIGVVGVVLGARGDKRIGEGINLYNSSFNQAYILRNKISVHFGITQHGLELSCKF